MTAAERLVVLLARGELSDGEAAGRALLRSAVHWDDVLRLAQEHEVLPLVHWNTERLSRGDVPPAVREALAARRRIVAARNGLLARELVRVLDRLDAAGVPAIPMKGVALAETLYGDPSLRDCADIDVLVPRERAREALRLLRALGYAPEFRERFFETLLLRSHIEYTLARRERGFEYVLDLHWGIGWSPRADRRAAAALWAERRQVTRLGREMVAMSPEWELLTLAVHAARHGWRPLKWLVDVHDYCRTCPLDWRRVRETAQRFGWLPALEQTLGACRSLLGTPPPPGLDPVAPAGWVPALDGQPVGEAPGALVPLRVIGSSAGRVRYLLRQVLVPTLAERRLVRLPSALGALYFPLRPVRLGGKWGWWLVRAGARRLLA